jgi:hypothetical protein
VNCGFENAPKVQNIGNNGFGAFSVATAWRKIDITPRCGYQNCLICGYYQYFAPLVRL